MSPGSRRAERLDRPVPRWVPALLVLAVLAVLGVGYVLTTGATATEDANEQLQSDVTATAGQALDLAQTIAAACAGGTIPAEFAGACSKAAQVRADPIPGSPGPAGAAGVDGTDGATGAPGIDGMSPPCLTEADRCRGSAGPAGPVGRDGTDGVDGAPGADGAPGRDGVDGRDGAPGRDGEPCTPPEVRARVVYADGQTGSGCVDPPPPAPESE